jgi:hypothetical protein
LSINDDGVSTAAEPWHFVIGILRGKQPELRSLANHIQAPGDENMPSQGLQQMIRGEFGGPCAQRKIVWP